MHFKNKIYDSQPLACVHNHKKLLRHYVHYLICNQQSLVMRPVSQLYRTFNLDGELDIIKANKEMCISDGLM